MQLNLKNGPNFYGKNYKINSLNYNVNSIADNVDSINDGLFQIYNNAKNIETGIKNDILSISRNCTLYSRLMPIYQNHDTSALCDNERKRLNFAALHSKYIKNSVSGIKNEQIKYNAIMKSLQAQSQSIK